MLINLPGEILIAIAEALVVFDPQSGYAELNILSFLLSCRRTYKASKQVLNRYFIYTKIDDNLDHGNRLLRQLTDTYQGDYLSQLRHIRAQYWSDSERSAAWKELAKITGGQMFDPETACRYLCRSATNLQSLDVEYPTQANFLNMQSETIRSLTVRSEIAEFQTPDLVAKTHKIPVYNPLKMSFLPFVLEWPRLRHLCVESSNIFFDRSLAGLGSQVPPGSSLITDLDLRMEEFNGPAVKALIEASRALKSFIWAPRNKWPHISRAEHLPRTSLIASALAKHSDTLESLDVVSAASTWCDDMDKFGSLLHFTKLTRLKIDAAIVLGLPHCAHLRRLRSEPNSELVAWPKSFAIHLPPSLEALIVLVDKHLRQKEGPPYLLSIVEGIVSELQNGRLAYLREVKIEPSQCTYRHACNLGGDWMIWRSDIPTLSDPLMMKLIDSAATHSCKIFTR